MSTLYTHSISRDPEPLLLDGVHASSLESLLGMLKKSFAEQTYVFADLSLGAWRSHQVASEFCTQLGLTPPLPTQPAIASSVSQDILPPYAHNIGASIDAESRGDRTILIALDLATRVIASLSERTPKIFLVIAPHGYLPWENENLLFIQFLVQGLRGSTSRLILISTDIEDPILPNNWIINWLNKLDPIPLMDSKGLLGLVPGVIEPEVSAAIKAADLAGAVNLLPLMNRHMLVAPECRQRHSDVSRFEYDRLAVAVRSFGWLEAYAQFFGNNIYVEPLFLSFEAWQRFNEGGYSIALRLMERAISCTRTLTQMAICQSYIQGIRIALQRFKDAAEAPDPSAAIPQMLRGFLLQTKGWGLVMLDDPRAEAYLQEARILLEPQKHNREYLYLLNISALSRLKLGDLEGAMALEKEIEASLAQQAPRDWQLEYVNSINIARLHRRMKNWDTSEYYYQHAFATTLGARSESDAVYSNVCLAQLNDQRGRKVDALLSWIRACLHWVSCSAPEALAPRVVAGILGHKLMVAEKVLEEVSSALASRLLASWNAVLHPLNSILSDLDLNTGPPGFIHIDQMTEAMSSEMIYCAIGTPGWSILAGRNTVVSQFTGPNYLRLRSLLYALLKAMCPNDEFSGLKTIVIEDHFGCEIPRTMGELLETCIRLRIPKLAFGTEVIELDQDVQTEFEIASRVRLSSAVDRLEFEESGAFVTFKRYLAPKVLPEEESQILSSLDDQPSLLELAERMQKRDNLDCLLKLVRSLEQSRIANLYLPEDSSVLQRLVSSHL